MKKILLITGILLMFFSVDLIAQESKEDKKAAKKAKKEAKAKEKEEALENFQNLANTKKWAIQAQMVYDEKNNTWTLNPSTNFVSMEGEEVTVQMSFRDLDGWIGNLGTTDLGSVTDYSVVKSSKNVRISFTGTGARMQTVKFNIIIDSSGMARAYLAGTQTSRITLQGPFVPLSQADIFKDTTAY